MRVQNGRRVIWTVAFLCVLLLPVRSQASFLAATLSSAVDSACTECTAGWAFSAHRGLRILSLGVFDDYPSGIGLAESHEVSLWTDSGTLVASVTVPAGTWGTQVEDFEGAWHFITLPDPVTIDAGTYILASTYATTADSYRYVMPATSPDVTYLSSRFVEGFSFPTTNDGGVGYLGANFEYDPLPEPQSWGMAAAGLVLLARFSRTRSRRSA